MVIGKMQACGVWYAGVATCKLRGKSVKVDQALITVANTNSNTNPNLTDPTFQQPTLSAPHLYPTFYRLPHLHPHIWSNALLN